MPEIPEIILENYATAASLLGGGVLHFSLGQAREYFMRSDDEEDKYNKCIDGLLVRQTEEISLLVDNAAQDKSPRTPISTDELLKRDFIIPIAIRNLVDHIWEDSLRARSLENDWKKWRSWDRRGRRICESSKFINFGLWIALILDLASPTLSLDQSNWMVLGLIAVGLPFVVAGISWIAVTRIESKVTPRLDAERRGRLQARRFGDE